MHNYDKYPDSISIKSDNYSVTHASIGFLSWLVTIFQGSLLTSVRAHWTELVVATLLSSVIDLDHFIEAKSLSLKVVDGCHNRSS